MKLTALERLDWLREGKRTVKCSEARALEIIQADGTLAFGIEYIGLPDKSELRYTNTGDTYSEALCSIDEGPWFLSTWGDCMEHAEEALYEETGETSCFYCGDYAECEYHEGKNWSGYACSWCRENH